MPNPKELEIGVSIYGSSYKDGTLVNDILSRNISFELSVSDDRLRFKKLLTLFQLIELKEKIDKSLNAYSDFPFP